MSGKVKTILGCLLSVVLVGALVFEGKVFFGMLSDQHSRAIGDMAAKIKQEAKNAVTITETYDWPDAPIPAQGDTVRIPGTSVKVKVSGTLSSRNISDNGMITYTNPDTKLAEVLTYEVFKSDSETAQNIRAAMYKYAYGEAAPLFAEIPDSTVAYVGEYNNEYHAALGESAKAEIEGLSDESKSAIVKFFEDKCGIDEVKRVCGKDNYTALDVMEAYYSESFNLSDEEVEEFMWTLMTIEMEAADTNGDGVINNEDYADDPNYGKAYIELEDGTQIFYQNSHQYGWADDNVTLITDDGKSTRALICEDEKYREVSLDALDVVDKLVTLFGQDKIDSALGNTSISVSAIDSAIVSGALTIDEDTMDKYLEILKDGVNAYKEFNSTGTSIDDLPTDVVSEAPESTEVTVDTGSAEFYMQKRFNGNVPIIFDPSTGHYSMFVAEDYNVVFIQASSPLVISDDTVSVLFPNPKDDPMYSHNYSEYETWAAMNTQRELLNGDEGEEADAEYESGAVAGTAETYTAKSDNNKRKMMATYGDHQWNKDGTSKTTSAIIDTTSMEAKKSEWVLTETTYSYTVAGLQISNVEAKRSSTEFYVGGNINNLLESDRPYVLVIKLLNSDGDLLGVKVIDGRKNPIGGKNVTNFYTTVKATELGVGTDTIHAVQFEVY